jgi:hypothetical protein
MPGNRDEEPVGVARINSHLRNLLAVAQAKVGPGFAAIGGLVDAVADREVRTMEPFAAADVNNLRVGRRNANRADRSGGRWSDRPPGGAIVGRLPDASADYLLQNEPLAGNSSQRASASAAKGPTLRQHLTILVSTCWVSAMLMAGRRNTTERRINFARWYPDGKTPAG